MSDFSFSRRRDGTYRLDAYEGSENTVVIPSSYDGRPVTSIADNAFSFTVGLEDELFWLLSENTFWRVQVC